MNIPSSTPNRTFVIIKSNHRVKLVWEVFASLEWQSVWLSIIGHQSTCNVLRRRWYSNFKLRSDLLRRANTTVGTFQSNANFLRVYKQTLLKVVTNNITCLTVQQIRLYTTCNRKTYWIFVTPFRETEAVFNWIQSLLGTYVGTTYSIWQSKTNGSAHGWHTKRLVHFIRTYCRMHSFSLSDRSL